MANLKVFIPVFLGWETGITPEDGESLTRMFVRGRAESGPGIVCGLTYERWRNSCRLLSRPVPSEQDFARLPFADWCLALRLYSWDLIDGVRVPSDGLAVCMADWVWVSGMEAIVAIQRVLGGVETPSGEPGEFVADGNMGRLSRLAIRRRLHTIPQRDKLMWQFAEERQRMHPASEKRMAYVIAACLDMDRAEGDEDENFI